MKRIGILPIWMVLLAGCGSANSGVLEGTRWVSREVKAQGTVHPEGHTVLEFHRDGTLIYQLAAIRHRGRYALGRGNDVTIKMDRELEGRMMFVSRMVVEGEQLTVIDTDGTQIVFRKDRWRGGGTSE